jgi:hypothetical protein
MGVDNRGTLPARDVCNPARQRRSKAGFPVKGQHFDASCFDLRRPGAGLIEAADNHGKLGLEAANEVQHQPLSASGIETEDQLQDSGAPLRQIHPRHL